jgi:prepilin-type N-terminal cleavage/methylation domain-containing protein
MVLKSPHTGRNGFTLVELVVVMALMGVVVGFALPRFHRMTSGDATDDLIQWIGLKVQSLREKAQIEQRPWDLVFDFDAGEIRTATVERPMEEEEVPEQTSMQEPERRAMADAGADSGRIVDVILAPDQKASSGEITIRFYPQGYADSALIHLVDGEGIYRTLKIEPFLVRIKQFESYINFETS